ncbi:dockerin type I domain-containing protein [Desulfobulbus elongatus]|uniref:dockerin type I domain-containing protein n=1 Tax=Desulfobulbus elongatus TaxID=53332 RepID=UPI0006844901|nr:dockerin type I domain-containing protein [Desulfobulbus elongatus]
MPFPLACLSAVLSLTLLAAPIAALADWQADVGYTVLLEELGDQIPDGNGIAVCQVEASVVTDGVATWMPDSGETAFSGKTINDPSGAPPGVFSSHATAVGRLLYGRSTSVAPGITDIAAYSMSHWAQSGGLRHGTTGQPASSTCRLTNHSWVGSALQTAGQTGNFLRRLDWLADRDACVQIVGLTNSAASAMPLLASAFNVITVGRTDGSHSRSTAAVDAVYSGGRIRPDLVAPITSTSAAVPIVGGAVALLLQVAHSHPELSTDPQETGMTNRAGIAVANAERPEVVRAVLMAGADRFTRNSTGADIVDYRLDTANQAENGLDRRYGAGQLNIRQSYHILAAGEQNSVEDGGPGVTASLGFDYDPAFGGLDGSNAEATYPLTVDADHTLLTAALVWHAAVDGGTSMVFSGTTVLHDLDLELYDVTSASVVSRSAGSADNSEHLWVSLTPGHVYTIKVRPAAASEAFLHDYALAWVVQSDRDRDLIPDTTDNCRETANRTQQDSDGDGYGNRCDCDLDNNGRVDAGDYWRWRLLATIDPASESWNGAIDFNGNGRADAEDLAFLQSRLGETAPYY